MNFETKIAVIVRDDLAVWQKLNVTAFLTTGLVGAKPDLVGEPYEDADGNIYNPLAIQPIIVLTADPDKIASIYSRAMGRGARLSIYTEEMFSTGHDEANRAAVRQFGSSELKIVGLAVREDRKVVDKITKGARMHP